MRIKKWSRCGPTWRATIARRTSDFCTTTFRAPSRSCNALSNREADRNLVLIFADHNWKLYRALELARGELESRRDVYTYDALAWALYKNGQTAEAREAMRKALKLGTPEPSFREHARMILEEK